MIRYHAISPGAYPNLGEYGVREVASTIVFVRYRARLALGDLPLRAVIVIFFLFATFGLATSVRLERISPELRQALPGQVVTHVFALSGQGEVIPSFVSEHAWPVLSPERQLKLDGQKTVYLAVSVRVPEDAPEGERDRLTVRAGEAEAFAYAQAMFQPGLAASWPRTVEYLPPVTYLPVHLQNAGNGADTFLIKLNGIDGTFVFSERVSLAAGESADINIPITAVDTYRLTVMSLRTRDKKEGLVAVSLAKKRLGDEFRLIGRMGAAYSYPGGFSVSAGLAGPLSDFAYLNFGIGYALGSLPAGSASVTFDGGYFSVSFGRSYGLALGFYEDKASVSLSLSGPEPRGSLNLDFAADNASFGIAASLSRDPSFRLDAQLGLHAQVDYLVAKLDPDSLSGEMYFLPIQSRIGGALAYSFHYEGWPWRLRYTADWQSGNLLINAFSVDTNPSVASLGGRISWTGLGIKDWNLAFASNNDRLKIESPTPFYVGASLGASGLRAFVGSKLDLPDPWSDLLGRIEAEYSDGSWTVTVSGSSQASSLEGLTLWSLGGRLGWPLSENQFSLGVRAGSSYLRGSAGLDWSPWTPALNSRIGLEIPASGAMLRAELGHEWYSKVSRFSLWADFPWVVTVPPGVTEFFGGRRAGTVLGVVEVEGPERFRQGIVVRAGGAEAVTDAAGRFELRLPPGSYRVEIDRSRLSAVLVTVEGSAPVEVRLKQTAAVKLKVAVRSVIEGKVTVEGGALASLPRFAVGLEDEQGRETAIYTDDKGSFRLEGLPPGVYTVKLLTGLLPPGWRPVRTEALVLLEPGEIERIELVVAAPERKVYRGGLQIIDVESETEVAPPGAMPLVAVRLEGEAEQVAVELGGRVLAMLQPGSDEGVWTGRLPLPDDYEGPLQLQVVARAGDQEARFPFFISVNPNAPWGQVRTVPVAKPGQELSLAVHWYAPVERCWIEVAGKKVELEGSGSDCQGGFKVPDNAERRLQLVAVARTTTGKTIEIKRNLLIR